MHGKGVIVVYYHTMTDEKTFIARNIPLFMIRDTLENIPRFTLRAPFSFSWYEKGDEEQWVDIQCKADKYNAISLDLFRKDFGNDADVLHQRQCFLLNAGGGAIGTASAWFDEEYKGKPYGRLHWVAIVPEYQGRGLALPLVSLVLGRMRELGHTCGRLATSSSRVPAIQLYGKFGFVPDINNEDERCAWREIQEISIKRK